MWQRIIQRPVRASIGPIIAGAFYTLRVLRKSALVNGCCQSLFNPMTLGSLKLAIAIDNQFLLDFKVELLGEIDAR